MPLSGAVGRMALCGHCRQEIGPAPPAYHAPAPAYYLAMDAKQRQRVAQLTSDPCVVDGVGPFMRGVLHIPIVGREHPLEGGVWVSLRPANFRRATPLWHAAAKER
jgi:hypothetical protein